MNIASLFSKAGQPQEPAQQPKQQENNQPQQTGNNPSNQPAGKEPAFEQSNNQDPKEVDSKTGNAGTGEGEDTSPLAAYQTLFDNDDNDGEEGSGDDGQFFSYDPAKLQESVKQMQFVDNSQVEEAAQALGVQDSAALGQLLNGLAQSIYSKSAELLVGVANKTARSGYERTINDLPSSVRSLLAKDNLSGLNPQFQNKALQPLVNSTKQQFEHKYPDASPKEIADMTNKYMEDVAKVLSQKQDPTERNSSQNPTNPNASQDFGDFFQNVFRNSQ